MIGHPYADLLLALSAALLTTEEPHGRVYTSTREVRACLPLPDGRVLAGTTGGLALFREDGALLRLQTALDGLPGTRVSALARDPDGAVWVGTEAGLALLREQN